MAIVFWDASSLVKRYAVEVGSDVTDAIFTAAPSGTMATTVWGYAETYSVLVRKRNSGRLTVTEFTDAMSALQDEVIDVPIFQVLALDDAAVLSGTSLIDKHNVNTADAAILALLLRYRQLQPSSDPAPVLVAADNRLIRAAGAEGLPTLNPELLPAADIPAFLAAHSIL